MAVIYAVLITLLLWAVAATVTISLLVYREETVNRPAAALILVALTSFIAGAVTWLIG